MPTIGRRAPRQKSGNLRQIEVTTNSGTHERPEFQHGSTLQPLMKASRSALMVASSVVGMPCGKPLQVFSVPFLSSFVLGLDRWHGPAFLSKALTADRVAMRLRARRA